MPTESTQLLLDALKGTGAGAQTLQGNSPSDAADVGNPVKVAGVVNSGTPAGAANGQRKNLWVGALGNVIIGVGSGAGVATTFNAAGMGIDAAGTARPLGVANYLTDGVNFLPQRGDASGAYLSAATFWTESTAAQAAGATLNGASRSNGGTAGGVGTRFNLFVAEAFADQAGTLYIDKSVDGGTTWRQVASVAVTAGTSSQISTRISAASYRARFVNGGTANTAFLLTTSYTLA